MVRRKRPVLADDARMVRFDPAEWPGTPADAFELWRSESSHYWRSHPLPVRWLMVRADGATAAMDIHGRIAAVRAARALVAGVPFDEAAHLLRYARMYGFESVRAV